jgi:hypothetical protein
MNRDDFDRSFIYPDAEHGKRAMRTAPLRRIANPQFSEERQYPLVMKAIRIRSHAGRSAH